MDRAEERDTMGDGRGCMCGTVANEREDERGKGARAGHLVSLFAVNLQ